MLRQLLRRNAADKQAPDANREIDVNQAGEARSAGTAQIIDVREPDEWAVGHIPGAIHIPLADLARQGHSLDPNRSVITVCRSGNRSLVALKPLRAAGFTNARSLAGGMKAWQAAGQPVER